MTAARGRTQQHEPEDDVPPAPREYVPPVTDRDIPELPEEDLPEVPADDVVEQPPEPRLPPVDGRASGRGSVRES